MPIPRHQFRDAVATFFVCELEHAPRGNHAGVTARISIPGRNGDLERIWHAPNGLLEDQAITDMTAWITLVVRQALMRWTGPPPARHWSDV